MMMKEGTGLKPFINQLLGKMQSSIPLNDVGYSWMKGRTIKNALAQLQWTLELLLSFESTLDRALSTYSPWNHKPYRIGCGESVKVSRERILDRFTHETGIAWKDEATTIEITTSLWKGTQFAPLN
jgi:hypothetical protein